MTQFSKTCIPVDIMNFIEALVMNGDRTLLVPWVCKSVNANSCFVDSLIKIVITSKGPNETLTKTIRCTAKHIGVSDESIWAVEYILDHKGNILKTGDGCKALQHIGEAIQIPSSIIEIIVEYVKCPKRDVVALKVVQIIRTYLMIPLKDLKQRKEMFLKRCIALTAGSLKRNFIYQTASFLR